MILKSPCFEGCLKGFLRLEESRETLNQTADGIKVEFIKSAKAVYDLFSGMPLFIIPDIMGKLDMGNGRAVPVFLGIVLTYMPVV